MVTIPMQKPSGGCINCGGPVRTYKSTYGWTCAECVREFECEATREARSQRDVEDRQDRHVDEPSAR